MNVFGYDPEHWIYPLRMTKVECEKHVDLLYLSDQGNSHYCMIKNFNGLMHRYSKHQHRNFCKYCLHAFTREELLDEHLPDCVEINGTQKTYLPEPNDGNLQFTNHNKGLKVPFVIYADSSQSPNQSSKRKESKPNRTQMAINSMFLVAILLTRWFALMTNTPRTQWSIAAKTA